MVESDVPYIYGPFHLYNGYGFGFVLSSRKYVSIVRCITRLYFSFILLGYTTRLVYSVILLDYITWLYYSVKYYLTQLRGYIARLYCSIIILLGFTIRLYSFILLGYTTRLYYSVKLLDYITGLLLPGYTKYSAMLHNYTFSIPLNFGI